MKRFLHNMSIYSMASPRHKVLSIIQQESDPIEEHIAKIGLFGNTTDNLYHWIGEIAEYLDVICDYSVKTKSGRLKSSDYVRVFDGFGENHCDTKSLSHCEQEDSHLYRWEMNCSKHNIFYDFFFTVCSCISVKFVI